MKINVPVKMVDFLFQYENNLLKQGKTLVAGVDEAGRGPLAGPLVASAVILDLIKVKKILDRYFTNNDVLDKKQLLYTQIRDSKKVTEGKRLILNELIKKEAISYSIVVISHKKIDSHGIGEANQMAFYETINNLRVKPQHVFTDHFEIKKLTREHQTNITRGDSVSISVAAASILAKVHRDKIMLNMHKKYPEYGFDKHKGYGTKQHFEALNKHGPCSIHRKTFCPIKSFFFD